MPSNRNKRICALDKDRTPPTEESLAATRQNDADKVKATLLETALLKADISKDYRRGVPKIILASGVLTKYGDDLELITTSDAKELYSASRALPPSDVDMVEPDDDEEVDFVDTSSRPVQKENTLQSGFAKRATVPGAAVLASRMRSSPSNLLEAALRQRDQEMEEGEHFQLDNNIDGDEVMEIDEQGYQDGATPSVIGEPPRQSDFVVDDEDFAKVIDG